MIDCTLTTGCFCMHEYNTYSRPLNETIDSTNALMKIPINLVIYGDKYTIPLLRENRQRYGLTNMSVFIEVEHKNLWSFQWLDKVKSNRELFFPTHDSRTSSESHLITCNKFDLVLKTIDSNPFSTSKFGWIDAFLGKDILRISENYRPNLLPYILSNISDKFHIQVLNVCNKNFKFKDELSIEENYKIKKEYYSQYRWVVCGGFFTCGRDCGKKVLTRLKEIFIKTTELGFGHGEEMFYLEVLDEYYDDIKKSYGDYNQILDNFISVNKNIHYIFYFIICRYREHGYTKELKECCNWVLKEYFAHRVYEIPEIMDHIITMSQIE